MEHLGAAFHTPFAADANGKKKSTTIFISQSTTTNNNSSSSRRRRKSSRPTESLWSFRAIVIVTILFFVGALFITATVSRTKTTTREQFLTASSIKANSNNNNDIMSSAGGSIYQTISDVPEDVLQNLDAIFVLGGGVPHSLTEPPVYVQQRCDDAASLLQKRAAAATTTTTTTTSVPILCLSAGTAHLPQLMDPQSGLPIWESVASAAYLQERHPDIIDSSNIFVETTSYDTIGNAFFARTGFADIMGWRRILIITNEFHMDRAKAIFDWIFGLSNDNTSLHPYQLFYYSSPNTGLDEEAIQARKQREHNSLQFVTGTLSKTCTTLSNLWKFLNTQHDLYTASKLVQQRSGKNSGGGGGGTIDAGELVRKSYGAA